MACTQQTDLGIQKENNKIDSGVTARNKKQPTIIHKRLDRIGEIKECSLSIATTIDLIKNDTLKTVQFSYYNLEKIFTNEIDKNELQLLIRTFKHGIDSLVTRRYDNLEMVKFSTEKGFEAYIYPTDVGWNFSIQIKSDEKQSSLFLSEFEAQTLIAILEKCLLKV
jgi:hypothetical protein